jgi:UDPglucose--hexose-1-phosphate uridylyltransferase
MPELRKDPVSGRWVIISTDRGKRPTSYAVAERKSSGGFCPLCPGNEDKTPPEIMAYRQSGSSPNTTGWTLRVVSNKFPALRIEGDLERRADGIYDKMNGVGAHEVIVESPNHSDLLSTMSPKNIGDILRSYRERIIDLAKDKRFRYISIFRNQGEGAGASLEHPHSQLIALPVVPKRPLDEFAGSKNYFDYKERCIFCDIVTQELSQGERIVSANAEFLAIAPFASRFPFEIWILPRKHLSSFEQTPDWKFEPLAAIFSDVFQRLDRALACPPYNYMLHSAPLNTPNTDFNHWHFEIIPRLIRIAGFEWGSGFYINPTPPEEAAKFLRES